jgi:hypothetical protein
VEAADCWFRLFPSRQPSFQRRYAAYAHFRSKGWIPRSGEASLGFDYLLYDGVFNSAMAACTTDHHAPPPSGQDMAAQAQSSRNTGHDHAQ